MGMYYLSACHDCEEKVMWMKCTRANAEKRHKAYMRLHRGHYTELSHDYDEGFENHIMDYKSLGIR